jgi:hypothetical protein
MTERNPSPRPTDMVSGYPVPQVTNSRLVLADLRRQDGRELLEKLLGSAELKRLIARSEPFVVALIACDGGYRSTMCVIDEAHLRGYLDRAVEINMSVQVVFALEPKLASDLIRYTGFAVGGAGALPAGRA